MIKTGNSLAADSAAGKKDVTTAVQRRRKWHPEKKREIAMETYDPEQSISSIARKYGISPSLLFKWRRNMEEGAFMGVASGEQVVPTSKVKDMQKRINRLERLLGRKTEEVEILKEAVRIGREKKLISLKPLSGVGNFQ